jgi:hypothetical protein
MPKRTIPLTTLQISNAKPKEKEYKLTDGRGLYLLVTSSGGKLWRIKYRWGGGGKKALFRGLYLSISSRCPPKTGRGQGAGCPRY